MYRGIKGRYTLTNTRETLNSPTKHTMALSARAIARVSVCQCFGVSVNRTLQNIISAIHFLRFESSRETIGATSKRDGHVPSIRTSFLPNVLGDVKFNYVNIRAVPRIRLTTVIKFESVRKE